MSVVSNRRSDPPVPPVYLQNHRRPDRRRYLTDHAEIDASEIDVKAENAEVTLTGTVESRQTKRLVHNQLRIGQGVKV